VLFRKSCDDLVAQTTARMNTKSANLKLNGEVGVEEVLILRGEASVMTMVTGQTNTLEAVVYDNERTGSHSFST
jgi:hypothetical protein